MTDTYRVMSNDNDEVERVFEAQLTAGNKAKSRLGRCFDFIVCKHSASPMLVLIDLLFFFSTLWLYIDIVVALGAASLLADEGAWWLYALLAIPLVLQWILIVLRIRYACTKDLARAQLDWHLTHMIRPLNILIVNGMAGSAFLLLLPLYGAALMIKNGDPVPPLSIGVVAAFWHITAATPSSVFFTITFALASLANWRVGRVHYNAVKTWAALAEQRPSISAVDEFLTTSSPSGTLDLAALANEGQEMVHRTPQASFAAPAKQSEAHASNTFTAQFTYDKDYNNGKPRPTGSRKKRRGEKHKTLGVKVLPALDRSTHSGGAKEDQWGHVYSAAKD